MTTKRQTIASAVPADEGDFHAGTGNVFADLGLSDAENLMFKADLASRLIDALRASGMTQRPAAARLGWTQPEVTAFMKGRISGFSVERIMRGLKTMGKCIEVHIKDEFGESVVAV